MWAARPNQLPDAVRAGGALAVEVGKASKCA
jgi:hypothetical protein